MAALPAGWIDTGKTQDHIGTFTVDVAGVNPAGFSQNEFAQIAGIWLGLDVSGGSVACAPWNSAGTVNLYVRRNADAYAARTVIDTAAGACPQPRLQCDVTVTMTTLRVGWRYNYTTATGAMGAQVALFADAGTTHTVTVGGLTTTYAYASPTQVTAGVDVGLYAQFAFATLANLTDGVKFTSIVWNGEADPNGDRSLDMRANAISFGTLYSTPACYPPLKFDADVEVVDGALAVPSLNVRVGDTSLVGAGTTIANGATSSVNQWRWRDTFDESTIDCRITGGYTEDGVTTLSTQVPMRRLRPKRSELAPEDFSPLTLVIASPVSVLLSANNWSGAGAVALSGVGNKTWTVSGLGASVSRNLAGVYSAADSYTTTLHTAGEDVWGWSLYSYLDLNITSNVAATLTVTVNYVTDNALGTTTARTYSISVTATTASYRLDLLFPNEGGPDYWERVKSVSVAGFAVGVYTLNSAQLVAVENAYVKADSRKTAATDYQTGLVISQDGAYPAYYWGDNAVLSGAIRKKDDEAAVDGANSTSNGGCFKMNSTITALATELNRMEGVTATYSGAGIDADLTDSDGNVAGFVDGVAAHLTYYATWLNTVMGARVAPAATLTLTASVPCDRMVLCPLDAGVLVLPYRLTLGMMLESLVQAAAGGRAAAAVALEARRSATGTPAPTDTVIGTGTTDASGYAEVAIPTGLVGGAAFYAYLAEP
jgi:hypothetical protein